MWKIAYNILLHILLPFFLIFSLANRKIRANLSERLWPDAKRIGIKDAYWIHAASVGEAIIAETVVNYMRKKFGIVDFVITTNTYYARDMLRKKFIEHGNIRIYSLPFDLVYSIRRFMGIATFKLLVIVETEIWPNLIWMAKKRNIPVLIINGRISDKTCNTYRFFSFFLKDIFSDLSMVLAQSDVHAERFKSLGMDSSKIVTTGNIKYYREIEADKNRMPGNFITFGSIKEKELDAVFLTIERLKKRFAGYIYVVVPRELNLVDIIESRLSAGFNVMRYSAYRQSDESVDAVEAIVVDTVGDLLNIYKRSIVAFVGGSLAPYGGQNILEPLFFGTPVLFGPHIENFKDIAETALECNAGIMVKDTEELFEKISMIIEDGALRDKMGEQGLKIIDAQKAVMEKTVDIIMDISDRA